MFLQEEPAVSASEARLGELALRETGLTRDQLQRALADHRRSELPLGRTLVSMGLVTEWELVELLALQHQVRALDFAVEDVPIEVLRHVPAEFAIRHQVLPVERRGRRLVVAMADPSDLSVIDDLQFITRFDIEPVVASAPLLREALAQHYEADTDHLSGLLEEIEDHHLELVEAEEEEGPEDLTAEELRAQVEDAPVVKLINGLLTDAVRRGASDIHIEPYDDKLRIRYRVDGTLQTVMEPPTRMRGAITSRVKILADLDIAERRMPQDGRITMRMGERMIDFRVSTLPVNHGEKVVLRVLDKQALPLDLEQFGMGERAEHHLLEAIRQPHGMVLVTGPTGSGKTTTLYAALNRINTDRVNIMTAEDPIEFDLDGINQTQVRPKVGFTFAEALKSFLRQDPDVVMVGEVRDLETGGIAIKASLTGHLVFSTLHTNDAASTITRLVDMGLEPFNLASGLNVIVAQRLVRTICSGCRVPTTYTARDLAAAGMDPGAADDATFCEGQGCEACDGTGFSGRQGLYEVMPMSRPIRELVLEGASADRLQDRAVAEGMLTLREAGLEKARQGITTLEEVVRETAS